MINLTAQIEGIEWVILLIVVAALFLFGPSKIPELARGFGRALGEFRRGRMEVEQEINQQFATDSPRARLDRAANALGVSPAGRSDLQVKLDIARALDRASDSQVISAAQSLGVYQTGADIGSVRESVVKALNV